MTVQRFYAERTDLPRIFESAWTTGWLIFDRERLDEYGAAQAIAWTVSRSTVFRVRDALNNTNKS